MRTDRAVSKSQRKTVKRRIDGKLYKLTPRQEAFVHHYILLSNAQQAAIKAGYSDPNIGRQLITKDNVKAILTHERAALAEKFRATKERVVLELCRIAYLDPAELFDPDTGKLRPIHEIPPETRAAMASVNVSKTRTTKADEELVEETISKIKLWDKPRALEMLSKHLGLFEEPPHVSVEVTMTGPEILKKLADFIERTGIAKKPEPKVIDVVSSPQIPAEIDKPSPDAGSERNDVKKST
jgi:phage terminase small subunit